MLRSAVPIILFSALIAFGRTENVQTAKDVCSVGNDIESLFEKFAPLNLIRNHYDIVKHNIDASKFSAKCESDLDVLNDALIRREEWAVAMLDASSNIPAGLLKGNLIDLGMYDECIEIVEKTNNIEIQGHHCTYSISIPEVNLQDVAYPTLSICLPKSCTARDLFYLVNGTIRIIDKLQRHRLQISTVGCSPTDAVIFDRLFVIYMIFSLILISFLGMCTWCELKHEQSDTNNSEHSVMHCLARFSLKKNAKAILSMEAKEDSLPAIHGMRFLTMAWIIFGHEYLIQFFAVNNNFIDATKWFHLWTSIPTFMGHFGVDTFFVISGFLMTYLVLKNLPKQKSFNIPLYYLHRYLRITPMLAIAIITSITITPKLGSGPRWNSLMEPLLTSACREKWWSLLLYVQNFVDNENMCLPSFWYLSVDMQLFWISPIIVYPLYKKPRIGLAILNALLVASVVIPTLVIGFRKLPFFSAIHHLSIPTVVDAFTNVYIPTYNRAAPWLLGIYLGYEVVNRRDRKLDERTVTFGWLITMACFAFCTIGTRSFLHPEYKFNWIWETLFTSLSRPIWAIGICWILYACIKGHAGPISSFLSWRGFQPLSRISYCMYLIHSGIQVLQIGQLRSPQFFSTFYMIRAYVFTMTTTMVLAFIYSLVIESPVFALENILLKRDSKSRKQIQERLDVKK